MNEIVLYTRPGCHLCHDTQAILTALLAERQAAGQPAASLVERDISLDPELERAWLTEIPVVEIGDRRLTLATSPSRLRRFVDDALAVAAPR